MSWNWKEVLGDAAPVLGGILGGPAGAAVGGLIAKSLGVGDSEEDLKHALQNNPEILGKIKALEIAQSTQLQELEGELAKGRLDIAKTYASSSSIFKSGGRPFLVWTCGGAFAWQYVVGPIGSWLATLCGHPIAIPTLDMSVMMPVLLSLLGLGGMQTYERVRKVSNEGKSLPSPRV